MKKFYGILAALLILIVVSISISASHIAHTIEIFFFKTNISLGLLIALVAAFSLLASLSLLIALGLTSVIPVVDVKIKNKVEDAKLKQEIETDKVKQLEAKIKTLEEALKKVVSIQK